MSKSETWVNSCDKRTIVLENEFLEFQEELDKIILNQLCGEIMEEVMDLGECTCLLPWVPRPVARGKGKF
jgi:hypothetical protein